jgi:hypothetical protein
VAARSFKRANKENTHYTHPSVEKNDLVSNARGNVYVSGSIEVVSARKHLPIRLHQVRRSFEDELLIRSLRATEFTMNDAYTFDTTISDATKKRIKRLYKRTLGFFVKSTIKIVLAKAGPHRWAIF